MVRRNTYSIPKSMVADIWKDWEKIERYVSSSDCSSFAKRRCIVREANFAKLTKLAMSGSYNSAQKEHQLLDQFYKRKPCSSTPSFILNQKRILLKAVQVGSPS